MIHSTLNRTAAEIAAAALFETFPGIELLGGGKTSLGFSVDFLSKAKLPAEAEILIEERMRQIVREKRPIRVLEMVPFSARELLLKEGHFQRAEEVGGGDLVEVVRIGTFHDLSPGPHLSTTGELAAFKLWPLEHVGERQFRLSGCAFPSKGELKQFLKRLRYYPDLSHERAGFKKSLWRRAEGCFVWLPAGLKVRQEVIELLRSHLFEGALEVAYAGEADRAALHPLLWSELKSPLLAEIYLEAGCPWGDEEGLFLGEGGAKARVSIAAGPADWKEKAISSLQLTTKTLNILGFQHCLRLAGRRRSGNGAKALVEAADSLGGVERMPEEPNELGGLRLEFAVEDRLGRMWPAVAIEAAAKGLFITASVERLVALLLEKKSLA